MGAMTQQVLGSTSAVGARLFGGHGGHHGLRIIILVVVVVAIAVAIVLLVRRSRRRREDAGSAHDLTPRPPVPAPPPSELAPRPPVPAPPPSELAPRPSELSSSDARARAERVAGPDSADPDLAGRQRKAGERHRRDEPDQALWRNGGRRRPDLRGHARQGHRLPRAQRRRQVDHHADRHGTRPSRRRLGHRKRSPLPRACVALAGGGRPARGQGHPSGPERVRAPLDARKGEPHPACGASTRCSTWSDSPRSRASGWASSRWAWASAWASRRRCSATPASSCSTSPSTGWTPTASGGCASSCAIWPPRDGRSSSRATS